MNEGRAKTSTIGIYFFVMEVVVVVSWSSMISAIIGLEPLQKIVREREREKKPEIKKRNLMRLN